MKRTMLLAFALACASCFLPSWPTLKNLRRMSDEQVAEKHRDARFFTNNQKVRGRCRQVMIERNPSWPADQKRDILLGNLWIGMTEKQLLASWGYPDDVDVHKGTWGCHLTCRYSEPRYAGGHRYKVHHYVYVENGIVTHFVME